MAEKAKKSLRTTGEKAKAKEALRLGVASADPGDLTLENKLALRESPGWERWNWKGEGKSRVELVEVFLQEIAEGAALSKLCKMEGCPGIYKFLGWIRANPAWKQALQEAEQVKALVTAEGVMDRAGQAGQPWKDLETGKWIWPSMAQVKGDEIFVKTGMWMAERLDRKKFGEQAPLEDLKDELRTMTEEALMGRLIASLINSPEVIAKLIPQLKEILPDEKLAEIQSKALEARQEGSIPTEALP